jgi:hypothetical protein
VVLVVLVVVLEEITALEEVQLKVREQVLQVMDLTEETLHLVGMVVQAAAVVQEQLAELVEEMEINLQKLEALEAQVIMARLQLFQQLHLLCHRIGKQQQRLEELQEVEELLQITVLHKELQELAELVEVEEDLILQLEVITEILELITLAVEVDLQDKAEMD